MLIGTCIFLVVRAVRRTRLWELLKANRKSANAERFAKGKQPDARYTDNPVEVRNGQCKEADQDRPAGN